MTDGSDVGSDPATSPVRAALRRLLDEVRAVSSGTIGDYIPELALADPELLGLATPRPVGRQTR